MDKQDSLPHRIHRLYGQFNVLSLPIMMIYEYLLLNTFYNNRRALVPHIGTWPPLS